MTDEAAKVERNAARQEILTALTERTSWTKQRWEKIAEQMALLDTHADQDGWEWDDKLYGDERIEEALGEAQIEYEGARRDAEEMDEEYPVTKARGMQVVMFNKDGRVGDPIAYPSGEPDETDVFEVREWIKEAKAAGATGIELQGGFDGAESQEAMDGGNYEPMVTTFEVTLWEKEN